MQIPIFLQKLVAALRGLLPDLKLRFFLVDTEQDRRFLGHALLLDHGNRLRRHRTQMLTVAVGTKGNVFTEAAGERQRAEGCGCGKLQTR